MIFANNVFEQTENEEVNYSRNQIGCRVIETLLPLAKPDVLLRYTTAFASELRPLCSDRFASHVLQALHTACCETPDEKCKEFTVKLAKFLLNNLEDYVNDTYGTHVVRTILENFSNTLTTERSEIVAEYATRLMAWPHFKDLPYNELTSGLLQALLKALRKTDVKTLRAMQKKLLNESFVVCSDADAKLPDVFSSKPATALLEACINTATEKSYTQLYAKCFVGNVAVLSKKRESNFSIQKLLEAGNEKTEVPTPFDRFM